MIARCIALFLLGASAFQRGPEREALRELAGELRRASAQAPAPATSR